MNTFLILALAFTYVFAAAALCVGDLMEQQMNNRLFGSRGLDWSKLTFRDIVDYLIWMPAFLAYIGADLDDLRRDRKIRRQLRRAIRRS